MKISPRFVIALSLCLAGSSALAQSVSMARSVPYADDAEVSRKIIEECTKIQSQLAAYTKEFGDAMGVEVSLKDSVSAKTSGSVLVVEIVDAVSSGNAFLGHQKSTRIRGDLYRSGAKVASFKARRNSMGGAFGGYKGSCSVLGRTVKALGKDIALWLKNPQDDAELGDY
jgi:hypothetical protein